MAKTKINTKTKTKTKTKTRTRTKAQLQARAKAAGTGAVKSRARASASVKAPSPTAVSTAPTRLPRDPKGRRAQFYQDPAIDQLWAVVTAVTAEVSVAFDRLDTLERLLERDGRVTRATIEAFRPDESAAAERSQRREELIQRVFQVLSQYGR
jgi:hypothetical protein